MQVTMVRIIYATSFLLLLLFILVFYLFSTVLLDMNRDNSEPYICLGIFFQ